MSSSWPRPTSTMLVDQALSLNIKVSSRPSASTSEIRSVSASKRRAPAPHRRVRRVPAASQLRGDLVDKRPALAVNFSRGGAISGSCSVTVPAPQPRLGQRHRRLCHISRTGLADLDGGHLLHVYGPPSLAHARRVAFHRDPPVVRLSVSADSGGPSRSAADGYRLHSDLIREEPYKARLGLHGRDRLGIVRHAVGLTSAPDPGRLRCRRPRHARSAGRSRAGLLGEAMLKRNLRRQRNSWTCWRMAGVVYLEFDATELAVIWSTSFHTPLLGFDRAGLLSPRCLSLSAMALALASGNLSASS